MLALTAGAHQFSQVSDVLIPSTEDPPILHRWATRTNQHRATIQLPPPKATAPDPGNFLPIKGPLLAV